MPTRNYPKNTLGWTPFYIWKYQHVLFLFLCVAGVLSLKLMDKTNHCLSTGLDGTLRKWCLINGQQLFCITDAVSVQTHTSTHIHMIEERKIIITNPSSLVWKNTILHYFYLFYFFIKGTVHLQMKIHSSSYCTKPGASCGNLATILRMCLKN